MLPQTSTLAWDGCQRAAEEVLAQGLFALRSSSPVAHIGVLSCARGNYLFSLEGVPQYVGEAKDLRARVKQQFTAKTSTFYKTFCKRVTEPCDISAFRVQTIEVKLGRKELEEFGMVNASTQLNKSHRDKRAFAPVATIASLWTEVQAFSGKLLREGEAAMMAQPSSPWFQASVPASPGIYVVRAPGFDAPLYIGEGSDLSNRYNAHSTTTYFSALRRHVGTEVLGFTLQTRDGKARYFRPEEEPQIDGFLQGCQFASLPVALGRIELEELMIRDLKPLLNRKGNKH